MFNITLKVLGSLKKKAFLIGAGLLSLGLFTLSAPQRVQAESSSELCLSFAQNRNADPALYLDACNLAIRLYPNQDRLWAIRGFIHTLQQNHVQALKDYQQVMIITGDKAPASAYADLGVGYASLKDYDKALEIFLIALKKSETDQSNDWIRGQINYNLGVLYYSKLKQPQKALPYLETAQKLLPDSIDTMLVLGDYYLHHNQAFKAIDFMTQILNKIQPDMKTQYMDALSLRGKSYMHLKEFELARQDFEKMLSINPQNAFANDRLGTLAFHKKDLAQAQDYLEKALALSPHSLSPEETKQLHFNLTMLYWIRDQYEKALSLVETAITKYPNDFRGYTLRGAVNLSLNKACPIAEDDFKKACSLGNKEVCAKTCEEISENMETFKSQSR